jgi:plasmid stabilization system protein ParE
LGRIRLRAHAAEIDPASMTRADDEWRRALAMLAENPDGYTRAAMLARGFPLVLLNRLVRAGLAAARVEREERGGKAIEIVRVTITDAGRRALG